MKRLSYCLHRVPDLLPPCLTPRHTSFAVRYGDTIEETAEFLFRSGTIDEVRRKAEELGLSYKTKASA